MVKGSHTKWGTHFNEEELIIATEVLDYFFKKGAIPVRTPYRLLRYVVFWAHNKMEEQIEREREVEGEEQRNSPH